MDTSDIMISSINKRNRLNGRKRSSILGGNISQHAESSPSVSINVSVLDSSKRSLNRSVNALNTNRDQKRKEKQKNIHKEKRQRIIEKIRKINELDDQSMEESEENALPVHRIEAFIEEAESDIEATAEVAPSTSAPKSEQIMPNTAAAFYTAHIEQNPNELSKKSFGSYLVKKMTNSIKNKFNNLVKNSKAATLQQTKPVATVIQNKAVMVAPSAPQEPPRMMKRSSSAFHVTAPSTNTNKYLKKQNSMASCSSMSSISSICGGRSSANISSMTHRSNFSQMQRSSHHMSQTNVAHSNCKENKKPVFKSAVKVNYDDKHLYQQVND